MTVINLYNCLGEFRSYSQGDIIFSEGQTGHEMFIVVKGKVDITVLGHTIYNVQPGQLLGEMSLIEGTPRSASAVATEDCKVMVIDDHQFRRLLQQSPSFSLDLMRTMAERLRGMNTRVALA
jgi:CRP-like cAMP-binding protein